MAGTARGAGSSEKAPAPVSLPSNLTTSHEKLVYLYLRFERRADVREISRSLDLPQIRLYPVLESLVTAGHVERAGTVYAIAG